jgi:poly(hydroxyalkanoate) depolymerase family esterase
VRVTAALAVLAACSHAPAGHALDASLTNASSPTDSTTTPDGPGAYTRGAFASPAGQLDYQVYVPSGYVAGVAAPLVVVISGCAQTIDELEALSRYSELAEQQTFVVVYVAQSPLRNPALCWNWFLPEDQVRGKGEPSLLAGITQTVEHKWSIDPRRVFLIGPSAGGVMSVIMGATYPDLYAAIGVIAGCEYQGTPCGPAGGPDPLLQARAAYRAMGSRARVVPVIVFQGQADIIVAPINGQQVAEQWVATDDYIANGVPDTSTAMPSSVTRHQIPGGHAYTISDYGAMPARVELIAIANAGHSWPGAPANVLYGDPQGPDATAMSYAFFAEHPAP